MRISDTALSKLHHLFLAALFAMFASFSFSSALVEITFVLALTALAVICLSGRQQPLSGIPQIVLWPLIFYAAAVLFSVTVSDFPKESFRGVLKVSQQILILIMAAQVPKNKITGGFFEKLLLCVFALVIANGLAQYALGTDLLRGFKSVDASAGVRLTSSFKSYGLFASFLVLILPAAVGFAVAARKNLRYAILLTILAAEGLICLYLTRSRGAWLAFFLSAFASLVLLKQWRLALILTLAAAAGAAMLPRNVLIHLDANFQEQSVIERLDLWQRAVYVIEAEPLTGTGINTYTRAHQQYDKSGSWRVRDYYAHNGYLQMAAEIGLPGAVSFGLFGFGLLAHGFLRLKQLSDSRQRAAAAGLWTGAAGFLIFSAWDTLLHNPQSVMNFYFISGILIAALKPDKADYQTDGGGATGKAPVKPSESSGPGKPRERG